MAEQQEHGVVVVADVGNFFSAKRYELGRNVSLEEKFEYIARKRGTNIKRDVICEIDIDKDFQIDKKRTFQGISKYFAAPFVAGLCLPLFIRLRCYQAEHYLQHRRVRVVGYSRARFARSSCHAYIRTYNTYIAHIYSEVYDVSITLTI